MSHICNMWSTGLAAFYPHAMPITLEVDSRHTIEECQRFSKRLWETVFVIFHLLTFLKNLKIVQQ